MTVAEIAKLLLHYSDQHTLTAAAVADDNSGLYLADVVRHINGGAQELFAEGPEFLSRRPIGGVLPEPVQTTINSAVQYSTTAGVITTHSAWMTGCTVRIEGQPDNRLISYNAGVSKFLLPLPTSGNITATIYADAYFLGASVSQILPRPEIPGSHYLEPALSESDLQDIYVEQDYGRARHSNPISTTSPVGTPLRYWIEPILVDGEPQPRFYLRVLPMPNKLFWLKFSALVSPPIVAVSDLDAANEGAGCTKTIPIPTDWNALYLIPIILQRYTGSPMFRNAEALKEINRQYTAALLGLKGKNPQAEQVVRFKRRY